MAGEDLIFTTGVDGAGFRKGTQALKGEAGKAGAAVGTEFGKNMGAQVRSLLTRVMGPVVVGGLMARALEESNRILAQSVIKELTPEQFQAAEFAAKELGLSIEQVALAIREGSKEWQAYFQMLKDNKELMSSEQILQQASAWQKLKRSLSDVKAFGREAMRGLANLFEARGLAVDWLRLLPARAGAFGKANQQVADEQNRMITQKFADLLAEEPYDPNQLPERQQLSRDLQRSIQARGARATIAEAEATATRMGFSYPADLLDAARGGQRSAIDKLDEILREIKTQTEIQKANSLN